MGFGENCPGTVAGAVVHQDDLEGAPHLGEGAHQALAQLLEVLFFIEDRNDGGDIGFGRLQTYSFIGQAQVLSGMEKVLLRALPKESIE